MGSDALEIDAEGLPLFRSDPACVPERLDVARGLELERQALFCEDLERCGIQKGGKAVRSTKAMQA